MDFNKSKYLKKTKIVSDLKGYKRMGRIDTPLLVNLLQTYSSYCSRVGVMGKPDEILTKLKKEIPDRIT